MARYCYHCGEKIRYLDKYCPYCSVGQSSPGNSFIGFLIYYGFYIFVGAVFVAIFIAIPALLCSFSYLINLAFPYQPWQLP